MAKILRDGDLGERERVSEGYLASLQEQYDTSLRFETDMVGEFLDALDDQGRLDAALVVLTADHGEELFDHGGFSHAYTLHSELLRVPLFVKLPGQTEARVVGDPVQLVDLAPTIMEVAGLPAKDEGLPMDGRSLVPLLRGETLAPARIVHDVSWPRRIVGRGLVDGDWKYVEIDQNYEGLKDAARLWNLRDDPRENHDLLAAEPERAASMKAALASAVAALSSDAKPENVMTEEERRQLEALGYLE
jgi:arylsulfatase A-like enzyme